MEKRTDLALEVREMRGDQTGIRVEERKVGEINITTAWVDSGQGEEISGKKAGKYITIDVGRIWLFEPSRLEKIAHAVANEIKEMIPQGEGDFLVVGLGNESITADAVGPKTIKKIIATRHLKEMDNELFKNSDFASVAAIAPGVLGQTGIEGVEIIKGLCEKINPKCVILIDALASRRLERLATTLQITDAGICPGSGVSNNRPELSRQTLGREVISIGVPTVVDMATLVLDLLEENLGDEWAKTAENIKTDEVKNTFVTLKDSDVITASAAKLISMAINMALHQMTANEIREFSE